MNGYIQPKTPTEPIFNEFGDEISAVRQEQTPLIPCKYYTENRHDFSPKAGGTFPTQTHIITTKNMHISGVRFALYDSQKNFICEKDRQRLERLENIKRTKIIL